MPYGVHDPPAPGHNAYRYSSAAEENQPNRDVCLGSQHPIAGYDLVDCSHWPYGIGTIVSPMCESDVCCGDYLEPYEYSLDTMEAIFLTLELVVPQYVSENS